LIDSSKEELSFEELIRLCKIFINLGINKFKITGGEPLLKSGLVHFIQTLKNFPSKPIVTLTTNGILLNKYLEGLYSAKIDAINISLDTLKEKNYEKISNKNFLKLLLENIHKALEYPDIRLKINSVILKGYNDDEIISLAELAQNFKIDVRYIEIMPIGHGKNFDLIPQDKIKNTLEEYFGKSEKIIEKIGNGPSKYIKFSHFKGLIGFISAITHEFCQECNRIRLTSDGYLKGCLQYTTAINLKKLLIENYDDKNIKEIVANLIYNKPKHHQFSLDNSIEKKEIKSMIKIGG